MKTFLRSCLILAGVLGRGADVVPDSLPSGVTALVLEAREKNPEFRYYEAELVAARSARVTAGRRDAPEVSGSVGQKRVQDPLGQLAGEGVAWSVGVSQSFEWPGRLGLRKAIANRDVALAELGLGRFQLALAARVRGEAQALSAAQEKARVAGEVAERYRALRAVLVQRDPAGITPQLEMRILEATEVSLRRRATEAGLTATAARLSLNQLLGRAIDAPLTLAVSGGEFPAAPPVSVLLEAAWTNNFGLRVRAAELEQQGFRVSLARNERWPAFKVGPQFTEENGGGRDRILGVGVSFPLPLWRGNTARVEAAQARQIQAETLLNTARRDVERHVVAAAQAYETKRNELAAWSPDAIQQFADAAALADRHYRLAAVPATTYVELQKQYLEAVEALLDTRREVIAAAAELEELTGLRLLDPP